MEIPADLSPTQAGIFFVTAIIPLRSHHSQMAKLRLPVTNVRSKALQSSLRRSYFFIVFILLLLSVAVLSLYGSTHLHNWNAETAASKVMSSVVKRSEEQLAHTTERIFGALDVTSSYLRHRLETAVLQPIRDGGQLVNTPAPVAGARQRLAYAITITKDGNFQDGAAVLAYSIMKYARNSSYDISLIAFVHPNVTTSRQGLRRLGFHVIEVPTPVNTSAIQFPFLRDHIDKNGCCGAAELIKITSYR
jgi:hypothetical protein